MFSVVTMLQIKRLPISILNNAGFLVNKNLKFSANYARRIIFILKIASEITLLAKLRQLITLKLKRTTLCGACGLFAVRIRLTLELPVRSF